MREILKEMSFEEEARLYLEQELAYFKEEKMSQETIDYWIKVLKKYDKTTDSK